MQRLRRVLMIFFICSVAISGYGLTQAPGSQYYYLGTGVAGFGLGFTGYTDMGTLEASSFNPAALGDLRRVANSLTFGGLGSDNMLLGVGFALPTDVGVFSINSSYMGTDGPGLDKLFSLSLGLAKSITEKLYWGFGLKFLRTELSESDWQLAFDMGILYRNRDNGYGFGFHDFSYGIVLKNIGKPVSIDGYDSFPALGLGLGASFYPLKLCIYKMRLSTDLSMAFNTINPVINIGMEHIVFDMFKIRLGYLINSDDLGVTSVGPFTLGFGFSGKIKLTDYTDVDISYSMIKQEFNGKNETAHFLNINVAWGYYDRKSPSLKAQPNVAVFSPNFDGSQDQVKLKLKIKDNTMVDGWQLTVVDKNKKVIRTYKSVEKLKLRTLNFEKFVDRIFSAKRQVEIPSHIMWDGKDSKGKIVSDGSYSVHLKAWDENKNHNTVVATVRVDNLVPEISCKPSYMIFSPNKDGAKEKISFALQTKNFQLEDSFIAVVRNDKGKLIKIYRSQGKVPATIEWDGTSNAGQPVPEGIYHLELAVSDPAGNKRGLIVRNFELVRTIQKVENVVNNPSFSPDKNGVMDSTVFNTSVSDARGLERWVLRVFDVKNRVVKEIRGKNKLPGQIVWDGSGNDGLPLADGFYSYQIQLHYSSGNHPTSTRQFVEIDTTPAEVKIKPQYVRFSPNGDGKKDSLTFTHVAQGQAADQITAKIISSTGDVIYSRKYKKKDFPNKFVWKGLDKNGKPLPEGTYSYQIDTLDKVGNKSSSRVADILLKTGLEKVAVTGGVSAFSPGTKGAINKIVFSPRVSAKKGITSFQLQIIDSNNRVVRSFDYKKYQPRIVWDGNKKDGRKVEDGNYSYVLKVKYNYGDEPVSVKKRVVIDTKPPRLKVHPKTTIFSPNNDGRKETLNIVQTTIGGKEDIYQAQFVDSNGLVVRRFRWVGNVPKLFVWDGKDGRGRPVAAGKYRFVLKGRDKAGNSSQVTTQEVVLVRKIESLTLQSDLNAFSPNGDGKNDRIQFSGKLSSEKYLQDVRLVIYDRARRVVRSFSLGKQLPRTIVWDGKNNRGRQEREGVYEVVLSCDFSSGNQVEAKLDGVRLDAKPPIVSFLVSPLVFTPDGDGEDDTLYVNLGLRDFSKVAKWSMKIYKKVGAKRADKPFKTFSGTGNVRKLFKWDGYSDDREDLVEAVQEYQIVVDAVDTMGNRLPSVVRDFTVGVLVEKTPAGLRIRVSSIKFPVNRARMIGNSKKNLDKVIYIIRKIISDPQKYGIGSNYKIEVSGHTDDTGSPRYNMGLSRRRARTVYRYFLKKDIDPKVLRWQGYGMTRPYKLIKRGMSKEKKKNYRARNRRVEFFIRK